MKRSPIAGFIIGILTFALASLISRGILHFIPIDIIWFGQVLLKAILIVLSVIGIRYVLKISLKDAGFRKAVIKMKKWNIVLSGMVLGGLATVLIFFTPAKGIPLTKQLNILEFLLVIIVWSSLSEEIFLRGFIQPYLKPFEHKKVNILNNSISVPVLTCALVFSAMHLSLLFVGADYYTVSFTLLTTFLLGLLAGAYREKYGSVIPSVITHMSFNIGGIIAGIIIAILYKILTGELPQL